MIYYNNTIGIIILEYKVTGINLKYPDFKIELDPEF